MQNWKLYLKIYKPVFGELIFKIIASTFFFIKQYFENAENIYSYMYVPNYTTNFVTLLLLFVHQKFSC